MNKTVARFGKWVMGVLALGCITFAVLITVIWYTRSRLLYNENYRTMDENGVVFDSDGIFVYALLSICFWVLGVGFSIIYLKLRPDDKKLNKV